MILKLAEEILRIEKKNFPILTMCTILPVSGLAVLIQQRDDDKIIEYLS